MSFIARSAGALVDDFFKGFEVSFSFPRHQDEAPTFLEFQPQISAIGADGQRSDSRLLSLSQASASHPTNLAFSWQ